MQYYIKTDDNEYIPVEELHGLKEMTPSLISRCYFEWSWWHRRVQKNDDSSFARGAALVAECMLSTVLIYNGTKEYYEHGNGD